MPDQSTPKRRSPRPRVLRICEVCNTSFLATPRKVEAGIARFCSVSCRGAARRTGVERLCSHCGKSFIAPMHKVREGLGKYCSHSCSVSSKTGESAPHWQGGRTITPAGYIRVRRATGEYVFEHRIVMEQIIGRLLLPEEVVHHCDGDRANNLPENLRLFSNNAEHMLFHSEQRNDQ